MTVRGAIAALVAFVIGGCASGVPRVSMAPGSASDDAGLTSESAVDAAATTPVAEGGAMASLGEIAARATSVAPGLREVARFELAGEAPGGSRPLVEGASADTCLRALIVASPAVHASLIDSRGNVLADAPDVSDSPLAPRGPVCVRRGEAITLRIDARAAFTARVVAWASP